MGLKRGILQFNAQHQTLPLNASYYDNEFGAKTIQILIPRLLQNMKCIFTLKEMEDVSHR
jgi:hypothetical protein